MYKRILIASGAVVLTALGAFAGRLTAKSTVATLYANSTNSSVGCHQVASSISQAFAALTTGGSGNQASIVTSAGGSVLLFSTANCSTNSVVRFRP